MKNSVLTLFLIMILLHSVRVFADVEQVNILKGNKAYSAGAYSAAVESYQKVIKAGFESPELYYNLGNAYFKMNDFAHAILWYERAQRLDPGNEDIDFNLKVAYNKIADKIEPLPELFYKRWFNNLEQLFSVDAWAWTGIIFLVVSLSFGALYLVSRILFLRKAGFWLGLIFLFFSFLSLILAWSGNHSLKSEQEAIVFTPTITIKSSPDDKSTDLFVLHEGAKVQLIDNISGWYEIRIANGSVGWLPVTAVERI